MDFIVGFSIVAASIIVIGGLLIFCTGFIRIKRNHVAVIERLGLYVGVFSSGLKYFAPFLYRRVGLYRIGQSKLLCKLPNGKEMMLYFSIDNYILFHYSGHNIDRQIKKVAFEHDNNLDINILINGLKEIGVHFIDAFEHRKDDVQ